MDREPRSARVETIGAAAPGSAILRTMVAAAITIPFVIAIAVMSPVPLIVRLEAALLWALCLVPAWTYLRTPFSRRRPFPFMPLIGTLYGLYYALPAAFGAYNQHYKITLTPQLDYD